MKIELNQNEIDFLTDVVREKLLIIQDELEKEPEVKSSAAFVWDLYQKLLHESKMPGARAKNNPHR